MVSGVRPNVEMSGLRGFSRRSSLLPGAKSTAMLCPGGNGDEPPATTLPRARPSPSVNKRTVIIAFKVLESIWHMTSSSLNTSSFTAFNAPKVELRTIAILEIDALGGIDYPALKPCLLHKCSRVT